MPRHKLQSIDFSILPYSFQRRLIDLTHPTTLWNLRQTGHAISKLTSLRGYFANAVVISHHERNIIFAKYSYGRGYRYLCRETALTFKHIYTKYILYIRIDVNAVNTKLLSLIVPTYQCVMFAEDGYTIEEMVKFFHPKLICWNIVDSALLQTREKWIKYWVTMFTFIRSRKNAIISLLRCPAGEPTYYNKIKEGIARFCPTYRVIIKENYVIIERKRGHYLNP